MKKYSSITRVNSHRISRNRKLVQAAVISVVLLALLWVIPSVIARVGAVVFSPVYAMQHWLAYSTASFPYFLRDRVALIEEISDLKSKTPEGGSYKVTINALVSENRELRRVGGASLGERVTAGVIGRPPEVPYDVLVIDQGETDGISIGAPVYVSSTTVIGIIAAVYPHSAVVELVSAPGFVTSVYLYGADVYTHAEGIGGGVLKVGVPQGVKLGEGDIAIVPSVDLGIFGEVVRIESSPTSPEQYGFITTNIPIQSIRLVSVGTRPLVPVTFSEAQSAVSNTIESIFKVDIPLSALGVLSTSSATSTDTTSQLNATTTP